METMTSAYANKLLKQLEEEKHFWLNKESSSATYVAAINEEPVVPEYDYSNVAEKIETLDKKIAAIKHAINISNANTKLQIGEKEYSVDTILVRMAQLNGRKAILDSMRKKEPKTRCGGYSFSSKSLTPEYRYINYNLDIVKKDYERISTEIMQMQMALDYHNQTVQFEVEI